MNKKFIWTIIILLIIAVLVFVIVRKPKEQEDLQEEEIVQEDFEQEEEDDEDEEEVEVEEYTYTGDTDFSEFTTEEQTVGQASESTYSIEGVEDGVGDGYHEITFSLRQDQDEEDESDGPLVTAGYITTTGAIRVDFQGISQDSSNIGYLQEREIEKDGILKIYHNVSTQQDQEIYDIGILQSTSFKLSSDNQDGIWTITLQVKYPGLVDEDVDLGSDEFSSDTKKIENEQVEGSVSITTYSYGRPSGLLMRFVWGVNTYTVPSVEAMFNADGDLVVIFEDITTDRVVSLFQNSVTLPSGIKASVQRIDSRSIYLFEGIAQNSEYRLGVSRSPYMVVLEIKN